MGKLRFMDEFGVSGVGNGVVGERDESKGNGGYAERMAVAIQTIYEGEKLRPLEPLELAENSVVQILLETGQEYDAERREWLDQGRRSLTAILDIDALVELLPEFLSNVAAGGGSCLLSLIK